MLQYTKKLLLGLAQLGANIRNTLLIWLKIARVVVMGFIDHRIALRASALTFFSLLSVVPVVALAFGISKGFGFENKLHEILQSKLASQQEVLNWILTMSDSVLERTRGGLVASVGMAVLFLSIMKVLDNMENSFNDIWQIHKARSIFRKFSDYISILLFAPVFIIVSSSATVTITAKVDYIMQSIKLLGYFSPLIVILVKIIPYLLIWILFTLIYIIMPNTLVKYKSGIIAGIIAGSAFQITQWAYIKFQIGVSAYNAIYGSFAALPLFMVWLQTGWIIVLLGAELAFVVQNYKDFDLDKNSQPLSDRGKKTLSLLVMQFITRRFVQGTTAPDAATIANSLNIHAREAQNVIKILLEAGLISEVLSKGRVQNGYQPAFDINLLTVKNVVDRVESLGVEPNNPQLTELAEINKLYATFDTVIETSPANILIKDL